MILRISYIPIFGYFLHLDIIKSEINFKLKVKMKNILFSMGIDHSNPYIHSTTVLCDIVHATTPPPSKIASVSNVPKTKRWRAIPSGSPSGGGGGGGAGGLVSLRGVSG